MTVAISTVYVSTNHCVEGPVGVRLRKTPDSVNVGRVAVDELVVPVPHLEDGHLAVPPAPRRVAFYLPVESSVVVGSRDRRVVRCNVSFNAADGQEAGGQCSRHQQMLAYPSFTHGLPPPVRRCLWPV